MRFGIRCWYLAAVVALAGAGCDSDGSGAPDAGAGAGRDAEVAFTDAGPDGEVDAGAAPSPDAGPALDTGPDAAAPDAGTPGDAAGEPMDAAPDGGAEASGVLAPVPLDPSPAFLARQASYLEACAAAAAPGVGDTLYGQVCRVARGLAVDPAPILAAVEFVDRRADTADFDVAALVRLLSLDRRHGSLDPVLRARIEQTVLGFKYWLDEPGADRMCYWSENHQILFHSSELLAGALFSDRVFPNSGLTGAQHVAHAAPLVARWLELRARFGFSEWHSNVYFNEDIPALVNLADFAASDPIRTRAAIVLDLLALDLLGNSFDGYLATVHGRTYPNHTVGGLRDSTASAAWLMTGLGQPTAFTNFSGAFLASSAGYAPPPLLEDAAAVALDRHEHRQRDGIDVADGPAWGLGYADPADVVRWAGMVALAAPEVIDGTAALLDAFTLWDAFLFGDLPDTVISVLQAYRAAGQLAALSTQLAPVTRGIALQSMSTYTWRTPWYQLSGAQDYHPGSFGAQTHAWQATLDGQAYVFTNFSCSTSGLSESGDLEFGGAWIGCWLPRATFHRNVGVIQYVRPDVPLVGAFLEASHTHAYLPRAAFDEVQQAGGWTFGRKGQAYLALWSQAPSSWAPGSDFELDAAEGPTNTYVVELGSRAEHGSFAEFVDRLGRARIEVVDGRVLYESPSVGRVEVGWEGPLTVAGVAVDLGPFDRWDDRFVRQPFGTTRTELALYGRKFVLDFDAPARQAYRTVRSPDPFDFCRPATPPDAACHAAKRAPDSPAVALASQLAGRWVEEHPAATLAWNWEEAVLLFALTELQRVTGEARWQDYTRAYLDRHLADGYRIFHSDSVAPAAVAQVLFEQTGEPAYAAVVDAALHYLFEVAPRDAAGGINHLGTVDGAGITLWADSLFMFGNVLNRRGEQAGDARALGEYSSQFALFSDRLQDDGGLFTHAWNWVIPQEPGVYWARGNAWITAASADYLRVRRLRGEQDEGVRRALGRQVRALLATQDPATGLWWTVLNRPGETYLETSGSALIAWGLARAWRYGYAGDEVLAPLDRARQGLASRIRRDEQGRPVVTGTSGPTIPAGFQAYADVRQLDDLPYGVGAVILALIETAGLPAR